MALLKHPCRIDGCLNIKGRSSKNLSICHKHYKQYYKNKYGITTAKKWKRTPKGKLREKEYKLRVRTACIAQYSNNKNECACCQETTFEFLTIDHINNDGAQHRKSINHSNIYVWLRKNNYPSGFQVLCMNCNFAKGKYGMCPHQKLNLRKVG